MPVPKSSVHPTQELGFNPCFRGTCSWWNFFLLTTNTYQVSILVFVELALDAVWSLRCIQTKIVSILVFVELALDDPAGCIMDWSFLCFNPCFRGTCSWCTRCHNYIQKNYRFQSLFSWNLLLMRGSHWLLLGPLHGVSILVFVELALDGCDFLDRRGFLALFQSLFSWNLLLMCMMMDGKLIPLEFQSLFSWNLLLMSNCRSPPAAVRRVSILVFVELALDGYCEIRVYNCIECFNPCFRGTCSWWFYAI